MAPPADAILAFASGFPLVLLGVLLLLIRPLRAQPALFGIFAVLWGLQVVTINFGRVFRDAETHETLLLVSHVFMIVATLFLTHFAARLRPDRFDWVPTTAIGAFTAAAFVAYLVDPTLFVRSVTDSASGYTTAYGPLIVPLVQLPFFAAFVVALLLLYRDYRKSRAGTARHRVRGIMLALLLFIAYQFPRNALAYLSGGSVARFASGAVDSTALGTLLLVAAFIAGTFVLFAVALHAYLRPPPPETGDFVLLACFVFPAAVATLEWVLTRTGFQTLETLGFWRLIAVGVLVFTLANYQLFDLDVRIKRYIGPGLAAALVLFGIPLVLALAQGDFGLRSAFATLLPEVIAVSALLIFRNRIGEELLPGAKKKEDKGYAHQRHLELYKVALEDVLSRGGAAEDRTLAELRARYHISDDEHKVLAWMTTAAAPGKKQPTPSVELLPGSVVLERYRIERLLGEGTRRATYLATDTASRQLIAIKAVRTDALEGAAARLLVREARLVATLNHPNILAVFDVAEEPGVTLIVMDYADEGNLNDYLDRNGPMDVRDAVRFLSELLAGLGKLHEHAIVHRNLKPKNILLDADGTVLISDLSAAYAAGDVTAEAADELAANALQDLLYLSPEQLRGETPAPQSDLYVAAVLFHLALTGQYPLRIAGRSDSAIRTIILEQPPKPHLRDDHPEWIAPFLMQALGKTPDARFPSAAAMRDALHQHAGIRPVAKAAG